MAIPAEAMKTVAETLAGGLLLAGTYSLACATLYTHYADWLLDLCEQ
jgi:hypothetical protein